MMSATNAITIQIHLAAPLMQNGQPNPFVLTLEGTSTVDTMLNMLIHDVLPKSSRALDHCLVIMNDCCVIDRTTPIQDGAAIFLLSPISGG